MNVLLVTAHPRQNSLTCAVQERITHSLVGQGHSVETADLYREGFDPILRSVDEPDWHDPRKEYSPEVRREMARVQRNDASILLFPVYWWSMPALMKGWIDRVWNHGWAYGDRQFPHKTCWMIAIAGNGEADFKKRGYDTAIRTQLETGILDYCGIADPRLEILYGSIEGEAQVDAILRDAKQIASGFGS